LEIFRRLAGEGRTLVMVTHDRGVAEHADRILNFDDGRIAGEERIRPPATDAVEGASASL
jgi:ABC-type lipoprotein export system ATPase subunit